MNPPEIVGTRHGLMAVRKNDKYVGRMLAKYGEYIRGECDVIERLLPKGGIAIDAGANIGALSMVMSKAVGESGIVVAFEPQRALFYNLCCNMTLNGIRNVYCLHKALGDVASTAMVPELDYDQEGNFGALSLLEAGAYQKTHDMVPVDVIRIDDMNLLRCDLIKIDVEGMEIQVLEGARETIAKTMPALCVEDDRPGSAAKIVAWLAGFGYSVYQHFPKLFVEDNFNKDTENIFGDTVSANLVCFHSSRGVPDWLTEVGLTPVSGIA